MLRRFWPTVLIISLIAFGLSQQNVGYAANQSSDSPGQIAFRVHNQTIPTRTPTPGPISPPPPTATQKSDGNNPTDVPTAVSTSTDIPQSTATPTALITIVFTPVNGFMPTAEPCSNEPTILANNPTNVRTGPSANEAIVIKLAYLEVHSIIGRAADTAWWQILLPDGQRGWVADSVVTVNGYIGNVPITDGNAPSSWNPTPNPVCTVTPTPVAVASETAAAVASETADAIATTTESAEDVSSTPGTAVATGDAANSTTASASQPTQTAVAQPTLAPATASAPTNQVQTEGEATAVEETTSQEEAVIPLNDVPARSTVDLLLPAAGILLLASGIIIAIKKGRSKEADA